MARATLQRLPRISYSGLSFEEILADLQAYIKRNNPANFNDFLDSNAGAMFMQLFSYFGEMLGYRMDVVANEVFIATVRSADDAIKLLALIDYHLKSVGQASAQLDVSRIDTIKTTNNTSQIDTRFYDVVLADYSNGISTMVVGADGQKQALYTVMNEQFDYESRVIVPHTIEYDAQNNVVTVNPSSAKINAYEGFVASDTIDDVTGQDYQSYLSSRGSVVFGSLRVYLYDGTVDSGGNAVWTEIQNSQYLAGAPQSRYDKRVVYRYEYTSNYNVKVMFGSSAFGGVPMPGNRLRLVYMVGTGASGNMPSLGIDYRVQCPVVDTINSNPNAIVDYINCYFVNKVAATGGADPETIDHAVRNAPLTLKSAEKMVTREDYKIMLEANPSVQEVFVEDDSVNDVQPVYTVNLYVLQQGGKDVTAYYALNSSMFNALTSYVNGKKVVGIDNVVLPAEPKVVNISVYVKKQAFGNATTISAAIKSAVESYINVEKFELGADVFGSELVSIVQQVNGVEYVEQVAISVAPNITVAAGTNELVIATKRKASDSVLEVIHSTQADQNSVYNYLRQAGSATYDPYYHTYKKMSNVLSAYDFHGVYLGSDTPNNWLLFAYNKSQKYDPSTKKYYGGNPYVEAGQQKDAKAAEIANIISTYAMVSDERALGEGQGIETDLLYNYFFTLNSYDATDPNYLLLEVTRPDLVSQASVPFDRAHMTQCLSEGIFSKDQSYGSLAVPSTFPATGMTNEQLAAYFNWYIGKYYGIFAARNDTGNLDLWMEAHGNHGVKLLSRYPFSALDSRRDQNGNVVFSNAFSWLGFPSREATVETAFKRNLPFTNGTILRQGENRLWFRINGRDEYVTLPLSTPSTLWVNPGQDMKFIGTSFVPAELVDGQKSYYEFDDSAYSMVFAHYPNMYDIGNGSWKPNSQLDLSDDPEVLATLGSGSISDVLFRMTEDFGAQRTLSFVNKTTSFPSDADILGIWRYDNPFFDLVVRFHDMIKKEQFMFPLDKMANTYGYNSTALLSDIDSFLLEAMKQPYGTFVQFVFDTLNANYYVYYRLVASHNKLSSAAYPIDVTAVVASTNASPVRVTSSELSTVSTQKDLDKLVVNLLLTTNTSLLNLPTGAVAQDVTLIAASIYPLFNAAIEYDAITVGESYLLKRYPENANYMKTLMGYLRGTNSKFPLAGDQGKYSLAGAKSLQKSTYLGEFVTLFSAGNNEYDSSYFTFQRGAINDQAGWFSYRNSLKQRVFHTLAYEISRTYRRITELYGIAPKFRLQQAIGDSKVPELPDLADTSWDIFNELDYPDYAQKNMEFKQFVANTYVFKVPRASLSDGYYVLEAKAVKDYDDPRFVDLDGGTNARRVYIQRDMANPDTTPITTQVLPYVGTLIQDKNMVEILPSDVSNHKIVFGYKAQVDVESPSRSVTATIRLLDSGRNTIVDLGTVQNDVFVASDELPYIALSDSTKVRGIVPLGSNWGTIACEVSFFGERPTYMELPVLDISGYASTTGLAMDDVVKRINSTSYNTLPNRFLYAFTQDTAIGLCTTAPYLKFADTSAETTNPYLNNLLGLHGKVLSNQVVYQASASVFSNLGLQAGQYYIACVFDFSPLLYNDPIQEVVAVWYGQTADYSGTLGVDELRDAIVSQIPNENATLTDSVLCGPQQFPLLDRNSEYLNIVVK